MDGSPAPISLTDPHARLCTALAPELVDVRRDDSFSADDRMIIHAFHHSPDDVERWRTGLPPGRPVAVYCADGRDVSQGVATALSKAGVQAGWRRRRSASRPAKPPAEEPVATTDTETSS